MEDAVGMIGATVIEEAEIAKEEDLVEAEVSSEKVSGEMEEVVDSFEFKETGGIGDSFVEDVGKTASDGLKETQDCDEFEEIGGVTGSGGAEEIDETVGGGLKEAV